MIVSRQRVHTDVYTAPEDVVARSRLGQIATIRRVPLHVDDRQRLTRPGKQDRTFDSPGAGMCVWGERVVCVGVCV